MIIPASLLRRSLLVLAAAVSAAAVSLGSPAAVDAGTPVYFGTYTDTGSQGIYVAHFDPLDGSLSQPELAARTGNPSFLAFSPDETRLYAANEVEGTVSAFSVDRITGRLGFLDTEPADGTSTAHVIVDPSGRVVIAANYGTGTVAVFPVAPDGGLRPRSQLIVDRGPPGPNRDRQATPHAHSVNITRDGRLALVCDLGLDRILVFRIHAAQARLTPAAPPFGAVPPGSGPRHSAFSPDGRFLYVVNEMGGTVCVFSFGSGHGPLVLLQTLSALPPHYRGFNGSAELQLSADGRFAYVSNRGPDDIAAFARDPSTGRLHRPFEFVPCGGHTPRNFSLSPDGHWLVCANQDSNNLTVFAVNPATGSVAPTAHQVRLPKPVCVLFLR